MLYLITHTSFTCNSNYFSLHKAALFILLYLMFSWLSLPNSLPSPMFGIDPFRQTSFTLLPTPTLTLFLLTLTLLIKPEYVS